MEFRDLIVEDTATSYNVAPVDLEYFEDLFNTKIDLSLPALNEWEQIILRKTSQKLDCDFAPLVNVKSFGTCKILTATVPPNGVNKPCVCPLVTPWLGSRMMVNVSNFTPLLENSKLMCTIGGVTTIKKPR